MSIENNKYKLIVNRKIPLVELHLEDCHLLPKLINKVVDYYKTILSI